MHAGMIRHRVDGGQQASASAIRTMALGRADNSSWVTPIRWIPGFKLCEVQKWGELASKKERKACKACKVPGCLRIKWEGKEWLTEGILIATELAGFAHSGGDVPPKDRLHRSTIPFPLCKPNAEMGQCCRNINIDYKSEHVTHHARKVHCFARSISDVERSGKRYSVRSTTLSPPGCLSPNLSGRREGSVLRSFLSIFICDEPNTNSTSIFEIGICKEGNKLLT